MTLRTLAATAEGMENEADHVNEDWSSSERYAYTHDTITVRIKHTNFRLVSNWV
jgi:hypothetical protein